ncbi:MAG: hypothetical protein ACRD0U_19075 [Acidimicrobiales bacterium]
MSHPLGMIQGMSDLHLPKLLDRLAEPRQGLVTLDRLRDEGISKKTVDAWLAKGWLIQKQEAVYRTAGAPETWEQGQLAACLATGGVASHRAAARLWDVEPTVDIPVEITVTRPHSPQPDGVVVHRSTDLVDEHISRRNGIPVTNPLRLVVDLGAVLSEYWVAKTMTLLIVKRLITVEGARRMRDALGRQGRRGAGVLRRVLDDWQLGLTRPDSVLEPAFARLCRRYNVPKPVFQYEVVVGGRRRRIDFAYPELMIAIEIDGFESRADRDVFRGERWRRNDLTLAGWTVIQFTWFDLSYRPDYVAATLRSLLGTQTVA